MNIHACGQKDSKYMSYQVKRAPLLDRTASRYSKDYPALPLGDNEVNTALAKSYKVGLAVGIQGVDVALKTETMYDQDFIERDAEEIRRATAQNCRPPFELTHTVAPPGKSLVRASHYHERFQRPRAGIGRVERAKMPMPGLFTGGSAPRVSTRTNYTSNFVEFGEAAQAAARGVLSRSTSTPGGFHDPDADPEIMKIRRACYLHPGR